MAANLHMILSLIMHKDILLLWSPYLLHLKVAGLTQLTPMIVVECHRPRDSSFPPLSVFLTPPLVFHHIILHCHVCCE
jgi:hypothetical protein